MAAYWPGRREEAEACAIRTGKFIRSLAKIFPYLSGWRETGQSKEQAIMNPTLESRSLDQLTQLFSRGFERRAVNHVFWNGKDEIHSATLNIRCGVHSIVPTLGNAVVLVLPDCSELPDGERSRALLSACANAWDPDWAVVTSQGQLNQFGTKEPFLDQALYLKSTMERPSNLLLEENGGEIENGTIFLGI